MISIKAFFVVNFLLAIIKLSLSQTFLDTFFELYARDNDVTEPFVSQYQLASTGHHHNISLAECSSYCSSLKYCFSIALNKNENYCKVFNTLPLLGSYLSPTNGSDVYIVPGGFYFFSILIKLSLI